MENPSRLKFKDGVKRSHFFFFKRVTLMTCVWPHFSTIFSYFLPNFNISFPIYELQLDRKRPIDTCIVTQRWRFKGMFLDTPEAALRLAFVEPRNKCIYFNLWEIKKEKITKRKHLKVDVETSVFLSFNKFVHVLSKYIPLKGRRILSEEDSKSIMQVYNNILLFFCLS